jgi:hypothetical protein
LIDGMGLRGMSLLEKTLEVMSLMVSDDSKFCGGSTLRALHAWRTAILPHDGHNHAFFGGSCKPLRCHFQTDDAMFESDTPETKHFIYFYVGSLAILIWKSWDFHLRSWTCIPYGAGSS